MQTNHNISFQKPFTRQQYLQIVHAALLTEEFRFAQDTVIKWLGSYPGDLKAGFYYAKALLGMQKRQQAITILRGLCAADPEYKKAAEMLLLSLSPMEGNIVPDRDELSYLFVMMGKIASLQSLAPWGEPLFLARQALNSGDFEKAFQHINQTFEFGGENALAAVTNLRILSSRSESSSKKQKALSEQYRNRWPDCLACTLIFSDCLMQAGDAGLAVALIHQVAGRDVGGQVAHRLWGFNHQYRALWPDQMERKLDTPIPGVVAVALGWNRLVVGDEESADKPDLSSTASLDREPPKIEKGCEEVTQVVLREIENSTSALNNYPVGEEAIESEGEGMGDTQPFIPKPAELEHPERVRSQSVDKDLKSIADAFERIALKVKLPGVVHLDGRFPVYVVFSLRNRLESIYGVKISTILDAEMWRLVEAVRARPGWSARLFFADDPLCTEPLGIKPVQSADPWELKLALKDLDAALGKRGEQIGALLIVGGPRVVPFHHLPNPIDDLDVDVPSDNPYATRDKNYFLPEWPVGRLPGGAGNDARLLLDTLRQMSTYHTSQVQNKNWLKRWKKLVARWLELLRKKDKQGFGYTAAIWQKAASEVFETIGKAEELNISPPLGVDGCGEALAANDSIHSNGGCGIPSPNGCLGYFNLHGLVDAPEWYGHSNPLEPTEVPDFPVALRPEDIEKKNGSENPKFVLAEACYGLHIIERSLDQAMSLKFLQAGSLAVVGSTSMAYGSIGTPLIAADYLSYSFWRLLKQGVPVGEALRQAKIRLADYVNKRQGFLDVEDQKTLISFNLYGDPLAQYTNKGRNPKVVRYLEKPLSEINTVSEGIEFSSDSQQMPANVMLSVKQVMKQYLPGMSNARVSYVCEYINQKDVQKHFPHGANKEEKTSYDSGEQQMPVRQVVTLSHETKQSESTHPVVARLTLDDKGKLVKLVVSH